jgi:hypothetical protein
MCLDIEPDAVWCRMECPPPGEDASAAVDRPGAEALRLASAGVLSPDQLRRLARLRGRG